VSTHKTCDEHREECTKMTLKAEHIAQLELQNYVFMLALSLYNIKLTFTITHTLFQLHLNHQLVIN